MSAATQIRVAYGSIIRDPNNPKRPWRVHLVRGRREQHLFEINRRDAIDALDRFLETIPTQTPEAQKRYGLCWVADGDKHYLDQRCGCAEEPCPGCGEETHMQPIYDGIMRWCMWCGWFQ